MTQKMKSAKAKKLSTNSGNWSSDTEDDGNAKKATELSVRGKDLRGDMLLVERVVVEILEFVKVHVGLLGSSETWRLALHKAAEEIGQLHGGAKSFHQRTKT